MSCSVMSSTDSLGASHRTVLTHGNKGETTQNHCLNILLRRTLCSQFWRQSICNKSICFLIDDIDLGQICCSLVDFMFLAKSTPVSFLDVLLHNLVQ